MALAYIGMGVKGAATPSLPLPTQLYPQTFLAAEGDNVFVIGLLDLNLLFAADVCPRLFSVLRTRMATWLGAQECIILL